MNIYINNYINPEDEIILIHSTLIQFLINNEYEKVKENFNNFFNNLIEQNKTILIPSFTYKTWDYNMKNVNTGIMSNIVIDNPNFKRTIHPIYSWFVAGKLQSEILNLNEEKSILGEGSVFEFIENYNTKIILLNTSHLTYVHRIEELCYVPYRYYKDVIKDISINNEIISKKIKIFVRDPKIDAKPYLNNEKQNALRKIKSIKLIEEGDMFLFYGDLKKIKEELINKLMNDKLFVVENKENIICKIINNYDNNININEDISKKFGYISNDINPIHVDNNFASKISEGIIIHGINIVFCILDKILKYLNNVSIQKINVIFEKLININKLYFISINYENDEYIIFIKDNDDLLYFKMNVIFYENDNENDYTIFESEIDRNIEKNEYDSIKLGKRDKINLFLNNEIFSIYENLRKLNKIDISILMGLTYIVGMKIPGYNSIFNEFYLENNINNIQQELIYEVIEKFDDLQKIKMSVNSNGKTGYIISQFRSPIIEEQDSIKVISKYIKKNQFINKNCLVIGCSNGLGELTTKIICSGNGYVIGTYNNNVENCLKIDNEVKKEDLNNFKYFKYNSSELFDINIIIENKIEYIFYYPTPRITGKSNVFDEKLLDSYYNVYIKDFLKFVQNISLLQKPINIIVPQSTAINDKPVIWKEYTSIKYMLQIVTDYISKIYSNINIINLELPKLRTNQTLSLVDIFNNYDYDTTYYMINIIKSNVFNIKDKIEENKEIEENKDKIEENKEKEKTEENKEKDKIDTNEIRIALLSTKNIDFINKELEKIIKIYNINKKIIIYDLDYDQMYQQIIDTNSKLYKFKPNFVFFLERIEDICKTDLLYQYKDEYESLFLEYINIIKLLNSNLKCNIFVNNFVLLQPSVFMNYDINFDMGISKMIEKWNKKLLNEKNINIIDLNQVKSINNNKIIDMREYLIGRYIFSLEFSSSLSIYYYSIILSYLEKNIRVIVLDLDNTLWGGVVGDDGNYGIEYGNDFPGNCFKIFQNYLKLLKNRGILLTISSKNNYDTVENVFKERKDFELKLDDFICIKANWEPKYKNVLEISREIGIGIDNFLFIDDNIVEREQMKLNIPNINILDLPTQPELYYESLIKSPFFNCIKIKEEDFKRNDAYIAKMNIDSSKDKYNNLEDFYKSIEYEVYINNLNNENFDRCVQLINKTNQFNMTTLRLNHEELKELSSNKLYQTFVIGYKDKYTSYENMGVLILKKNENIIEIVNYLMSCRIIGRGVEKYIFNWISKKYHNFFKIIGNFQVTDKNKEFEKIYFENDFIKENNYYYKKIEIKEYDSWAKLIDNTNDSEINIITKNKNEIIKDENIILIQDNIQKILNVLNELGHTEINQKKNFVSLNNWDSLKHVYFIGKLKNKYEVNINKRMYNLELTIEDLSLLF